MHKLTEDFLRPYSRNQVSLLQSMAAEMVGFGLSAADVLEMTEGYFAEMKSTMQVPGQQAKQHESARRCPLCGSALTVSSVNVSRCTNIGDGWKSVIICTAIPEKCGFTELSKKNINELMAE